MKSTSLSRRTFLNAGLIGAGLGLSPLLRSASALADAAIPASAPTNTSERVLVVVELSGGNDGLNTIVPYRNDEYYKARPNLGIRRGALLEVDRDFGLHPRMVGLRNLWDQDRVAIVHGCGYPNPIRSHFSAMEYWHTARPHSSDARGWLGRMADERWPEGGESFVVNIGQQESLAVRSYHQGPVIFSDPDRFARAGDPLGDRVYETITNTTGKGADATVDRLRNVARTALQSSRQIRTATSHYHTPVSYGLNASSIARDLRNVAALLEARFPAQVYYLSIPGFDTHGNQLDSQQNLLMYVSDALEGFMADLARMARGPDVAVLVFTEFGRRVAENRSGGTDHGTATPMWLIGEGVRGGFHGEAPSLTDLDDGDLKMTTDFRSVYSSILQEWMGDDDASQVLEGDFPPLGLFTPSPSASHSAALGLRPHHRRHDRPSGGDAHV